MTARLTVLIVDDTELIRSLLDTFVSSLGHSVVKAVNGREAVEYCRANRPDMILMDVMMPEMDGFEATREIRKLLVDDWVPIVFLTALSDQANLMKGLEIGGDDYLIKPIDFALLTAKLNVFLRINKLQKRIVSDTKRLAVYYEENEEEQRLAQHILTRFNAQEEALNNHVQQWLQPAIKFNGDVICAVRSPKGNVHVMLADSTGHGLTAAICCLPAISAFMSMTKRGFDINTIAREINDSINNQLPTGRFVAAAIASVDYLERTVSVWNGGIPCVALIGLDGTVQRQFDSAYPPLGIASDSYFDSALEVFQWEKDGHLVICSDGLTEATNKDGGMFGLDGVLNVAKSVPRLTVGSVSQAMFEFLAGEANHDDASIAIVSCSSDGTSLVPKAESSPRLTHTVSVNWEVKLSFTAAQLKEHDCFQAIVGWLNQIGLEQNQFSAVLLIISELFNNALDHGILGLSSSLKSSEGGFEKYLSIRQDKLSTLTLGEISIGLSRDQSDGDGENHKLRLWLSDSGPGFDYDKIIHQKVSEDGSQVHGRGIALIALMCESIRYVGNGSRVEVAFAL